MNKHHVTISMCGCERMAEWETFRVQRYGTRVRILTSPEKKGFQIRALKKKEILGVVPKSPCSSAAERLQHRRQSL